MSDEEAADSADESVDDGEQVEESATPDEAEAEADDGGASGVEEGEFLRVHYTIRVREDGRVVDTTREEVAEESEIDADEHEFEPRIIVVGAGHVFPAVDEALLGSEVGDSDTVEVSAEEGFGEFDPDDVRTVSAEKIDEESRYPGARVTVDGQQGHVETVIGGRARVDFNHPLAGDDLEYQYEILDRVEDREEMARGMLEMHLQEVPDLWIQTDTVEEEQDVEVAETEEGEVERETETVEVETETLYIEATPTMTMNQQWMFSKQQIAQEITDRLDLDRVIVQEIIEGGMGGMMGGMGGMGGMGAAPDELEEAIDDVDVDADEIVEELEGDGE